MARKVSLNLHHTRGRQTLIFNSLKRGYTTANINLNRTGRDLIHNKTGKNLKITSLKKLIKKMVPLQLCA